MDEQAEKDILKTEIHSHHVPTSEELIWRVLAIVQDIQKQAAALGKIEDERTRLAILPSLAFAQSGLLSFSLPVLPSPFSSPLPHSQFSLYVS